MTDEYIPFNRPYETGNECLFIEQAVSSRHLSGDGEFTTKCQNWLADHSGSHRSLLTHSCTAALEMAAIALEISPGDEVIMPSNTFSSTANAFALRGGVPLFVDIRADTLNLDEVLIEEAITPKTKAIVPVHYAGVGCEMDRIMDIAKSHNLRVVEDAAQGVMASYRGKRLGGIGDLGTYSFHETKNVISGEGGSLQINAPEFADICEMVREKGTDRSKFLRGEKDRYTWQVIGSSYLPSELIAAFLWAQLEETKRITKARLDLWDTYHRLLEPLEQKGLLKRPTVPEECQHNAHMYYIILNNAHDRQKVASYLKSQDIQAVSHYVPLHSSPAGEKFGRVQGSMYTTNRVAETLLRLPLWVGLTQSQQEKVCDALGTALVD